MIPNDSMIQEMGLPVFPCFFTQEFHCWWATGEGPPIVEDLAHTGAQLCKRSRDLQRAAPVNLETGVGGD